MITHIHSIIILQMTVFTSKSADGYSAEHGSTLERVRPCHLAHGSHNHSGIHSIHTDLCNKKSTLAITQILYCDHNDCGICILKYIEG